MIQKTKIEWCDYTANPIRYRRDDDPTGQRGSVWACVKASEGCQHCYAETLAKRFQGREFTASAMRGVVPYVDEGELRSMLSPRRLPAGSRCFVGDMTDVFGPWVPFELLDRVFAVMALRPDVVFQVLTKRPERMPEYLIGNSGHSEARLQEVINVQGKGEVSLQLNRAVQQRARRQSPGEAERSDRRPERFRGGQGVLEVHPFGNSGNDDRQPSGIGDVRDREDVLPRLHGGREVVDRVEERMEHICGERGGDRFFAADLRAVKSAVGDLVQQVGHLERNGIQDDYTRFWLLWRYARTALAAAERGARRAEVRSDARCAEHKAAEGGS